MTSSRRWWFQSRHSVTSHSPWLRSTLTELDSKTEAMLKLIEEDADSFAKRAEMYYKKRPELLAIVEDLYRSHRAVAENYDLLKTDSGTRALSSLGLPFSFKECSVSSEKSMSMTDKSYSNFSDTSEDSAESEVDDPYPEHDIQVDEQMEIGKLREEMERLRGENERQKEQLAGKDEEKREVIRQLSLAVSALKDENLNLRKIIAKETVNKQGQFELKNPKGGFLRKLFGGHGKTRLSVVAL